MIQLNDLRLGNKVLHVSTEGEKKVKVIAGILQDLVFLSSDYGNVQNPQPLSNIQPILLTPEILNNCGFTFIGDDWYEYKTAFGKLNVNIKYQACSLSDTDFTNECMISDYGSLKYVHQLQNICFYLTGKELNTSLL